MQVLMNHVITSIGAEEGKDVQTLVEDLIQGKTILLVDKLKTGLLLNTAKWPERSAPEPKAQRTPRGPDIGFNESITFNTALIRKYIKDSDLRIESNLNSNINTSFSLVYHEKSVDKEILQNLKKS